MQSSYDTFSGEAMPLPVSFAQERLWFLDRLQPGTALYNMPLSMRMPAPVDRGVLERCLDELVRRHEVLRTAFAAHDGRPIQMVSPSLRVPLSLVDLRRYWRHEREWRVAELAAEEARRPFNLARAPLLRATLYRLDSADHVLLLVMHHIVSDAWSMDLLLRELEALYSAFTSGAPSPLPPLSIQYADWAAWQRDRISGSALSSELDFWQQYLRGAQTTLDLPADRPRPPRPNYRGGLETFLIDGELAGTLRAFGQQHGCTLYMVLLAGFSALLYRYTGQRDLLIGSPVANRRSPEVESVVGLFVNTLVLRVDLGGPLTGRELLKRVRSMMLDVYAHDEIPFEKLIEVLHPDRSLGRHPLFQVLFSLQASPSLGPAARPAAPWEGAQPAPVVPVAATGTSKFDLSLLMIDTPRSIGGTWEYALDLLDPNRIRRMTRHFVRLLSALAERPDAAVMDLPLMDTAESSELAEFSARRAATPRAECVHDLFARQARLTPDAIAVRAGEEAVTYGDLAARAGQLAARLRAQGVGPEARVGLCLRRIPDLLVGVLGVLEAGGAYVPLDSSHPRPRLARIVADAGLTALVTETALVSVLPDVDGVLLVDKPDELPAKDVPTRPVLPDNLAYVLYTSGTTGQPKGVAVTHRCVMALLSWASRAFSAAASARVLASTSICFDISVFEIFLPLIRGGTVVLVENVLALATPSAPDVTLINTVPSAMRELLHVFRPPPALCAVNLAGEALPGDLVKGLHQAVPGVAVNNLYGPTETTVYSTAACPVAPEVAVPAIGYPIDGTVAYVLDSRLALVPVGIPGELYIGGAGVARGYLHRPELTAERYLPDPFSSAPGARMYRTGDIACWRADGSLEYRGRADDQVKLRGYRIEPGEVESALRAHPGVRDAVVSVREIQAGDLQLVAHVTTDAPAPEPVELERALRRLLPAHMVPSRIVFLEALPRTPSGKVDRRALPAPESAGAPPPPRAPASDTEAALCQLFAEVLGLPEVGPDGDFFALGGHSLLAMRIAARATEAFGVELPLSEVFARSTPALLAKFLADAPRASAPMLPARARRRSVVLPLSFTQEGLWFLNRLQPGTALYNLPMTARVDGSVDRGLLHRTLDWVVARHEALRTQFEAVDGQPVQRVLDEARIKLAVHDLSDLPPGERRQRAQQIAERESRRPFDLRRAPLARAALIRLSPDEQLMVLVLHHIVGDGWSLGVLLRDLGACYQSFARGEAPALPALAMQYGDYALWQRGAVAGAALQEHLAYFRSSLDGAPPLLSLPTDRPRPPQPSHRGDLVTLEIDAGARASLERLCARHGATPYMALLAAFGALLSRRAGQEHVVIGTPLANRTRLELKDVIGFFANTVPIRVRCDGHPTFAELLDRVRGAAIGAYAHQQLPFDRLVEELQPERNLAYHPMFQVMFGFQEPEADAPPTPQAEAPLATTGLAKFDLSLSLSRAGDRLFGILEYATDLFDRATAERMASDYRLMVETAASDPDRRLDDISFDSGERGSRDGPNGEPALPRQEAARAVAEAAPGQARSDSGRIAPRNASERAMAAIWSELLGHDQFGIDDSFFRVGGHSLAAVGIIARVFDVFTVELPLETVFTQPTIAALAEAIASIQSTGDDPALPSLRRVPRDRPLPLSFAQERLWFLEQLEPGTPVYNIPCVIRFAGSFDLGALERGIERLTERHECLRGRFVTRGGSPEQVFDALSPVELPCTDLSQLPWPSRQAEAERLAGAETNQPFDLTRGPLLRAKLLRFALHDHLLLVTVHHIVADGVSMDILRRDLIALYEAERTGAPVDLPDLPVQYADFAVWQRARLQGEYLATELGYWKRRLVGAPNLLALPTDRPRPSAPRYEGSLLPVSLGAESSEGLRQIGTEEHATPFMVLLALFGVVLARWSGSADLVVGTPIVGRPRRELEDLIGFFSNTLLMRLDLSGRPSFRELVRRVRDAAVEAFAHQDIPFEKIVEELQPARALGYNPLFQVMLALQRPGAERPEPEAERSGTRPSTAKFDLTLFLIEDTPFHGAIEYRTDLFDASTMERFAAHLGAMAASVAAAPDNALPDAWRAARVDRAALDAWNDTATRFADSGRPVTALFADQAARTPLAPAVSSPEGTWTYAELRERASRLAARLCGLGVGSDVRVALWAEPSLHLAAAVLGILEAGGVCVPIDPAYPAERLTYMVENSGARLLVTASDATGVPPDLQRVSVDGEARGAVLREDLAPAPDHLAYVIYTSGSTGRPKGVAMTHRALTNLVLWQRGLRECGGPRRTLQFASPSFDVFFQELLLCGITGSELVIVGIGERRDPEQLLQICRERAVERLFLPFVALRELAEIGANQPALPALREVITAGEQLQVTQAIRAWFSAHPDCRLYNQYGPSETHVVSEEALPADPAAWPTLPPIGRPIANTRLYVLDEEFQRLPIGVPGDLYIGGDCLARGYLGQPALNAERFLPDPYALYPGARMYRSGDRARLTPDGRLEFLGRNDDQVKVRGYRVELGEVEAALSQLPGVRQAVVSALPDARGDTRLVGYVLPDGEALDPQGLRGALRSLLPEPLIPSVIVLVNQLPRTPSGKVDRRALPEPPRTGAGGAEPRTEIERALARIWCEVLGLDRVGVDDDFFALGGHSLIAIQVVARVREALSTELPVRSLFEHPTIARLASVVAVAKPAQDGGPSIGAVARSREPLVSSFAQERLWFLDQLAPGNPAYNLTSAYGLPPSIELAALRRSLDELVLRHESLRTVFRPVGGRPTPVVSPALQAPLEVFDLSYLPAAECVGEVRRQAAEDASRSFDLVAGPLFRATLLALGPNGYVLLLAMHHIVSDAWSLRIIQRELAVLCEAFARGAVPSLPPLRAQYADYASWQRRRLSGEVLEELVGYWRAQLAGAPPVLSLATDRPRPKVQSFRGGVHAFEVDAALLGQLTALGRREGATLFMVLLAVYQELLRRYSGQEDILVGVPVANRDRAELESVVGLFVNTLVLRGDLSGDPSFRELLRRTREVTLGAYAHQELPFERVVEELQPHRDLGFNPLVQVAFGLQSVAAPVVAAPGPSAGPVEPALPTSNGTAKFDLGLVLSEQKGRLSAALEYDSALFDAATVERIAAHFCTLAARIAAAPDVPLSRLPLVAENEIAGALGNWMHGANAPAEDGLAERVAEHARRAPRSPAVEAPDGTLDYAEFDRRSGWLARKLRALGVAADVRVGVCLGSTLNAPVALVAILRAGGAYLPLDPALPSARLAYLVADAGAEVVITDAAGAARLGTTGARIVRVDAAEPAPAPEIDLPSAIEPDQLAYVIYTSGSTGRPKGAMLTHRGLRALLAAQARVLGLGPGDRVLRFATPSFDASVFELVTALASGATLCLERQEELLPGPGLVALLRRKRITMITLPPSSLGVLPVDPCPDLRLLFVAGEACPAELVVRWASGRRMVNGYGPTEATVWATYAECAPDARAPAIGAPVANVSVCLLDRHLQPVPAGFPGEICIGGPTVARGYLGRPDLTAASFVPDPWGPPGARMYRTGDLGRLRADGSIEFLLRLDEQVKIRGFRIEPAEVEAAIAALPGVAYAAVVIRRDTGGDPQLVAYVVPGEREVLESAIIRRALESHLPRYLVPSRVMIVPHLPRTPSGKLDRLALPPPPAASAAASTPPRGTVEETVCRICAEVLRVPAGRDDNFFELGGHSLLAMQVLSRMREELGVEVPARRIFEAATLAQLCEGLEPVGPAHHARIRRLPRLALQRASPHEDASASATSNPAAPQVSP